MACKWGWSTTYLRPSWDDPPSSGGAFGRWCNQRPLQLRSYLEKLKTRSLRLQCFNRTNLGWKHGEFQGMFRCGCCSGHDERSQDFSGQFMTTLSRGHPKWWWIVRESYPKGLEKFRIRIYNKLPSKNEEFCCFFLLACFFTKLFVLLNGWRMVGFVRKPTYEISWNFGVLKIPAIRSTGPQPRMSPWRIQCWSPEVL